MRFAAPQYLYALVLLPLLALFLYLSTRMKRRAMERFGNPRLLNLLTQSVSTGRRKVKTVLLFLALFFIILSLARFQWGSRLMMMKRTGIDVVIALDTSLSMLTEDMAPNRLEKAKQAVRTLIDKLEGDRIGLVAFAGDAFVHCPLTLDYTAAHLFLDIIDTNTIPVRGTNLARAIEVATGAFRAEERKYKVLILITDGESHEGDYENAAKEAARQGIRIYAIGIGTPEGKLIPLKGPSNEVKGYKKDRSGAVVLSRLDEAPLRKIALMTGGEYYRSTYGDMELDKIYDSIAAMEKKELGGKMLSLYEDRYQWFLGIGLAFLFCEAFLSDRRKKGQSR